MEIHYLGDHEYYERLKRIMNNIQSYPAILKLFNIQYRQVGTCLYKLKYYLHCILHFFMKISALLRTTQSNYENFCTLKIGTIHSGSDNQFINREKRNYWNSRTHYMKYSSFLEVVIPMIKNWIIFKWFNCMQSLV